MQISHMASYIIKVGSFSVDIILEIQYTCIFISKIDLQLNCMHAYVQQQLANDIR